MRRRHHHQHPHRRSPQIRSENTSHKEMVLPLHPHLPQPPNLSRCCHPVLARDYPPNPHTLPLRLGTARHHHPRHRVVLGIHAIGLARTSLLNIVFNELTLSNFAAGAGTRHQGFHDSSIISEFHTSEAVVDVLPPSRIFRDVTILLQAKN